jgi:hypothetical protein
VLSRFSLSPYNPSSSYYSHRPLPPLLVTVCPVVSNQSSSSRSCGEYKSFERLKTKKNVWNTYIPYIPYEVFYIYIYIYIYICRIEFFYVALTVHFSITLAKDQLDAQIFNTFITILYMYMFRAISCSSSGSHIVLIQHLVSLPLVCDRPVHTCVPDGQ